MGLLYRFRRLFSSGKDSRAKPTLRVVEFELKLFQMIKGRLKTNAAGLLQLFRRLFSSGEDSWVKLTLRVVAVEFKPFQII